MKNLKMLYSIFLIFGFTQVSYSQVIDSNDYFQYARMKFLNYVENAPAYEEGEGEEEEESGEFMNYLRWKRDFETKLDEDGKMSPFGQALYDYYQSNNDVTGNVTFNWEYNCPDSLWPETDGNTNTSAGMHLIISLWINPKDTNDVLAGCQYTGGLWSTTDNGNNWMNLTEDYPEIQGISSIYVNPNDTSKIFITTSYDADGPRGTSNGLYGTTDGGATWTNYECKTYDPFDTTTNDTNAYYPKANINKAAIRFIQDHEKDSIMYLLTPYRVLMSQDYGEYWTVIVNKKIDNPYNWYSPWQGKKYFKDIAFDPETTDTVYITGPEVLKIYDNGQSVENITSDLMQWTNCKILYASKVDAHKNYLNNIWFTYIYPDTVDFTIGINGDTNWIIKQVLRIANYDKTNGNYTIDTSILSYPANLHSPGPHYLHCEISPLDSTHIYIGYAYNFCYNLEGHKIYGQGLGQGLHNDIREVDWIAYRDSVNFLLLGTDGGLSKKYNPKAANGVDVDNYKYIANDGETGIRNLDIQGFDVSDNGEDYLIAGTSHDGLILKRHGVFFDIMSGGDQQSMLIDPNDANKFYVVQFGHAEISYSFSSGLDYGILADTGLYENETKHPPILFFKPNDPSILYAGFNSVIWEFDTRNIPPDGFDISNVIAYNFPSDTSNSYRYVKEVGTSDDLDSIFFISTNRYWMSWTNWKCNNGTYPHTSALYRVNIVDTGMVFNDISSNLDNGLCSGPITGITIEVSETDTVVYTCFGGTSKSTNPELYKKVYYSKDMGETWHAMADSLPEKIPANDIKYNKATGMLFLATDVGVYYFNRADSIWMNCSGNIPSTAYRSIGFSHPKAKVMVSTQAKGIYEADLPCINDSITIQIQDTVAWKVSKYAYGDIVIDSGAMLTVKSEVYMPLNSKIIVKRGAKLVVDGGKLTNSCDEAWYGVEVWGTSSEPPTNYTAHGTVILDNGAIIENALCGIKTIKIETGQTEGEQINYSFAGGKVIVRNGSIIRNCDFGVFLYPYNFDHASQFTDAVFETNKKLINTSGFPNTHLYLNQVYGIDIKGCIFINSRDLTTVEADERGMGIYSYNSGFNVVPYCTSQIDPCPTTSQQPNHFKNLYYGIKALNSGSVRTFTVDTAEFINNLRAIYIGTVDYVTVIRSKFKLGNTFFGARGIYLDECNGYTIEENEFVEIDNETLGIIVNNSGEGLNEIYKNVFMGTKFGILAQNENRNEDGSGLQIKCNEFNGNNFDLAVTHDLPKITKRTGIAANQGSPIIQPDAPAGNLFSYTGPAGTPTDINNQAPHITYYYHNYLFASLKPEYFDSLKVTIIPNTAIWLPEASCPSNIDTTGGGGQTEEELRKMMQSYSSKADSVSQLIETLEDAGSTEAMKWKVDMSVPPQSLEVYNQLMSSTPFISDSVMASAIEKETVLVDAMIRDVMVASPESAKNAELIEKLGERSNPLPEYMLGQILQGRSLVSVYGDLIAKRSFYRQQQANALKRLKRRCLNDTMNPTAGLDSLMVLLEQEQTKQAAYERALLYGELGDWSEGLGVMDIIPQQYILSGEDLAKHENLVDYFALMAEVDGGVYDSTHVASLIDLSGQSGKASVFARNTLLAIGLTAYDEPVICPDMLKSTEINSEYTQLIKQAQDHRYLDVFPNPAKDHFIVQWEVEKGAENMMIRLTNQSGQPVLEFEVRGKQNQQVVRSGKLKPAIYLVTLFVDDKVLETEKITISH